MDIYILFFRGQCHIGSTAGNHMDTTPKRKVGRPRINPIRPPKKTAKLAAAAGKANQFSFSISPLLKTKLERLANYNQITQGEQIRRLIDHAVIPDQAATDPSAAK